MRPNNGNLFYSLIQSILLLGLLELLRETASSTERVKLLWYSRRMYSQKYSSRNLRNTTFRQRRISRAIETLNSTVKKPRLTIWRKDCTILQLLDLAT